MKQVKREELLATIRADRERFDRILDAIPRDQLTAPRLPGGWSVKDVLAHIAWGDREGIGVIRARALVGSELWEVSEDERNEAVVRESRSRSLDDLLAEYRAAFEDYAAAIGELSDDELNEPDRFSGLTERIPGWRPWRVLYDPGHYQDHGRTIRDAFTASSAPKSDPHGGDSD
jgi:uncharacterized protein (TIGR03083 family)